MSKQSEDVLLMVKHVRHKKVDGTLYVNSGRVAWRNQTSDSFRISAAFEDIRLQRVSLDNKEKVQLQLLMHNGESFTFHFADTAGRDKQLEMRNKVKEMLQHMLPKFKDKAHSELNEKYRLLDSNPHLLALYKELVVTGILSSEEFWLRPQFAQFRTAASASSSNSKDSCSRPPASAKLIQDNIQVPGIPSFLLSDIKPEIDGANSIKYNLNQETIDAIFRAYPVVRQRHRELVPDKLSEAEFWKKFFQSHYFHRDRASITQDDVFGECDVLDERLMRKELIKSRKMRQAAHIDLSELEDSYLGEGYGGHLPFSTSKPNLSTNQLLLRRFNIHSIMIMRSLANHSAASAVPSTDTSYKELASSGHLKDKIYRPELERDSPASRADLELTSTKDYFEGPTAVISATTSSSSTLNPNQARQALAACRASLKVAPRVGSTLFCNNTHVQLAIADVSAGGRLMEGDKTGGAKVGASASAAASSSSVLLLLSSEQSKELRLLYSAAGELLRHFWACFPVTSVALAEKAVRIHESLGRFETTKLEPFIKSVESTLTNAGVRGVSSTNSNGIYRSRVTAHLESMLNVAQEKFREWQASKR